jgi:hypothetical protein
MLLSSVVLPGSPKNIIYVKFINFISGSRELNFLSFKQIFG